YLNSDAKPLYLDQGTDTAMYRYKLEGSTYKKAINFIVCNKITYDNHTNSYYVNPPGHGAVNLILNSSQNKDPLYLNCFPRTSFFYGFCENANSNILINSKKELQKQFGDNCYPKRNNDNAIGYGYTIDQYKKYINEKDIDSDFKEALWVFMEWIYEKLTKKKYKKFTELWKDLDDFLKYEETDNEDEKNEIRQLYTEALDYSQLLFDNYWCFYYEDSNGLESFLAELIFGKSGGWSGYQMRADKIDELPYVWKYRDLQKDEQHEARLLALYLGLPSDRVTKGEFVNGYKQTNVPQDKKKSLKYNSPNPEKTNMNSRFIYAKEITNKRNEKSNNNPRNCPKGQGDKSKPIDPKLPVLSSNGFKSSHHYRIKNKGKEKKGVVYKKSSEIGKRLDASTVMGKALNQYDIYKELKKQQKNDSNDYGVKISKVTNTKLPASAFAQYLLKNDKQVKANWQPDNSSQENNIILPTNQEWCHLFGHGDGGKEELGNFISGSKHCNTEQLGIEVGQRRVIQNTKKRYKYLEILEGDREKFKAKITAYSMPNQGVWKLKDKENQPLPFNGDGEQNLKTWLSSDDANEWKNKFCINGNQDTIKQNATELSKAFEELSESIKKAKDQDKEKLVMLQQHIEKNFFLLSLPLGRWMRYKIYYGEKKVFDHIYDAQSQSFDINEAKILDFTVERVLYQALADNTNGKDCYDKEYYEFLYRQKLIDRTVELVSNYGKKENGEILYKNALLSKFSEIKEINKSFYHIFKQQMLYVIKNKLYNELKDYKSVVEETITNFKGYKQTLSDEQEHSNCCVQIITGLEALLKAFDDNNSQAIVQNFEFISTKDPNK
ncbi:MAG: hypothetical protein MGF17_00765, partial [Trichodesmium sp. MAG_R04]|nr:hypothetical protein [Trichodesmium sp. MAG_R04]